MRCSGEDFKAAFSCFVYSTADPKGVDCIDKFKAMQTCFRAVCTSLTSSRASCADQLVPASRNLRCRTR